jgi:hypothetical protein
VFHGWGFRAISGITLIESVGSMSVSATSPLMASPVNKRSQIYLFIAI